MAAATTPVELGEAFPGSKHIANTREGVTDDAIRIQFRAEDVVTHLTMAADAKTEVLVAMAREPLFLIVFPWPWSVDMEVRLVSWLCSNQRAALNQPRSPILE